MFSVTKHSEMGGRGERYALLRAVKPLPYDEALNLWEHDEAFRSFFTGILSSTPFKAYRWETPPVSRANLNRPFEFVLVDAPELARPADSAAFREHFSSDAQGIVAFENLGGDAMMVVPSPRGPDTAYGHLGAFIRNAPPAQTHALWESLGKIVRQQISDRPLWLSTAGDGVAWLHVRLDSRPKYYSYAPYRAWV